MFTTSTVFKENLEQFPAIDALAKIEFIQDGKIVGQLLNIDGQKGSMALYFYLFKTMGILDSAAAKRGLELFAEHTADAKANPGKHPNIDRLLVVEANNEPMEMKVTYQAGMQPASGWDDADDSEK